MNPKQKKRLAVIISLIIILSIACGLVLFALKQNINLFYTPTQLSNKQIHHNQIFRIGGYVKKNSVQYDSSGECVSFIITDRNKEISVSYKGVLPNLFREGQTVVVTGKLTPERHLIAHQVLAKHDEKYMPSTLKKELNEVNGYAS